MSLTDLVFRVRNGVQAVLLVTLVFLGLPVSGAVSEEVDSLRIGGDYKFITLKPGADFRECRRACQNDVSCRAWTFIKERVRRREGISFNLGPDLNIGLGGGREVIPAQCRLKHSVGPKRSNSCCISGVKHYVEPRRPSKAERCIVCP